MPSEARPNRSRRNRAAASLQQRLARPTPTVWLSGQEAAEYVGVSWPTLRHLLIDHAIPHVRIGTLWRIEVAVLDEHLRRLAQTQAAAG
jgi:excisionase family DNA binding protein